MLRRFLISATLFSVVLAGPSVWAQQLTLPPVGVVLTLDIRDQAAWLNMQHDILGTMPEPPKRLLVTVPTRAGTGRAIVLLAPKFSATFSGKAGTATNADCLALLAEANRLMDQLTECWLVLDDVARDNLDGMEDYRRAAVRVLRTQQVPGWKT